jgi:hypothetical protein
MRANEYYELVLITGDTPVIYDINNNNNRYEMASLLCILNITGF